MKLKLQQLSVISMAVLMISVCFFAISSPAEAVTNLRQKLSGRILLQVESRGEAWYVNPDNYKRCYMGKPSDAFFMMKEFGVGIRHDELHNYLRYGFPMRLAGKILLDVESKGEAYYVYPVNSRGYFLGKPVDAFRIIKSLGLGISNADLNRIPVDPNYQYYSNNQNQTSAFVPATRSAKKTGNSNSNGYEDYLEEKRRLAEQKKQEALGQQKIHEQKQRQLAKKRKAELERRKELEKQRQEADKRRRLAEQKKQEAKRKRQELLASQSEKAKQEQLAEQKRREAEARQNALAEQRQAELERKKELEKQRQEAEERKKQEQEKDQQRSSPNSSSNNKISSYNKSYFDWPSVWKTDYDKRMVVGFSLNTGLNSNCAKRQLSKYGANTNNYYDKLSVSEAATIDRDCNLCGDYCAPSAEYMRLFSILGRYEFSELGSRVGKLWKQFNSCSAGSAGVDCRIEVMADLANIIGSDCHYHSDQYKHNLSGVSSRTAKGNIKYLLDDIKVNGREAIHFYQFPEHSKYVTDIKSFMNYLDGDDTTATIIRRHIAFKKVSFNAIKAYYQDGHRFWLRKVAGNNTLYLRDVLKSTYDTKKFLHEMPSEVYGYKIYTSDVFGLLFWNDDYRWYLSDVFGKGDDLCFDKSNYVINCSTKRRVSLDGVAEVFTTTVKYHK